MSKRSSSTLNEESKKIAKFEEYKRFVESPCQSIVGSSSMENITNKHSLRVSQKFDEYKRFISDVTSTSITRQLSHQSEIENSDEDQCDEFQAKQPTLSENLAYFVTFCPGMTKKTNLLLKLLHESGVQGIPKSYEKLMGTPKEKVIVKEVAGGQVFHYGLVKALLLRENEFRDSKEIFLDIGVDGASIFNSSSFKIWPIMGAVTDRRRIRPFLISCYHGKKDPQNSSFLDDLCDELEFLIENDIQFSYGSRKVIIRLFSTDAPARALLCSVKGHTSHDGCPFCIMKFRIWDGKVVFGTEIGPTLRSDETYSKRLHPEHHREEFKYNQSRLEKLFGMVSQFPPDPMHQIDLGVTSDKLESVKKGENAAQISERMVNFKFYRPNEFARDCRSLEYLRYFKATEFRQFLYYTCVAVLKDLVSDHIYYMWLLLHCAVRLMSIKGTEHVDQAEILIKEFVRLYPEVYGENSVTYNVHMLLHMPSFVRLYGPLDSFSAYKFENYIQRLKKYVGSAHSPLQQIYNRIEERNLNFDESDRIEDFDTVQLGSDESNSFFAVSHNKKIFPVKLLSILKENDEEYIKVVRCLNLESLFTYPLDSAQLGEISYDNLSETEETFPLSDLCWKYCRIPYEDKYALMPILHSSFHRFQK